MSAGRPSATQVRATLLGILVPRAAALPPVDGASADLFSIDGGDILLTGFVGRVTVAIPNVSLDFDIDFDPDSGGSDVALASLLAVDNHAAGIRYSLNTTLGSALVGTADRAANAKLSTPILLSPGDIRLDVAGGGVLGTTARVEWEMTYIPWSSASIVTAV